VGMVKKVLSGALGLIVVLILGAHIAAWWILPHVEVPEYEPVAVAWLDQGWTADDWQWYYHASQGGSMELPIPYDWMIHLEVGEVPPLVFNRVGRLMDEGYISRFGFLPNPRQSYDLDGLSSEGWAAPVGSTLAEDVNNNPSGFPVGFVKTLNYPDRRYRGTDSVSVGRVKESVVGFNCSACHTGQLNFKGTGIRIEGGPALTDLGQFRSAVGNAMALTYLIPTRFNRFANGVLGPDHTEAEKADLKVQLGDLIARGKELKAMLTDRGIYPTTEGFSRLDAVGRIGNYVMGTEISDANYSVSDAPVNFPHLWDTPWFEWVQYNASFKQPMMRNAGEAMGVFAAVNFDDIDEPDSLFSSTVNMANLYEMEALLRGSEPFTGLRAPEWPDSILGSIDGAAAGRGEALYVKNCQGCHLPPMTNPQAFFDESLWVVDQGRRYLRLNLVSLYAIGTDPEAAVNMMARTAQLGALGEAFQDTAKSHGWVGMDSTGMGGEVPFGVGLPFVISRVMQKKYDDLGLTPEMTEQFSGGRTPPFIQAPLAYKARPLNGVWATPPFLHNSSVQNIYQLLGPEEERDSVFWLGTKEYDPTLLGYVTGPIKGGFEFDTGLTGNSNKGHHFTGGPDSWRSGQKGVIGPALSEVERMDIIEFLKAMPSTPRRPGN